MTATPFTPRAGQIDFTHARVCPVVHCIVESELGLLLVQRSKNHPSYPGYWSGITGFLDDGKSVTEKALEEIGEELGYSAPAVDDIQIDRPLLLEDVSNQKTWLTVPVFVRVRHAQVVLDWEADTFAWMSYEKACGMSNLMPGTQIVLQSIHTMRKHKVLLDWCRSARD
ncbi:MAG: NUDIX domain-containing protein [Patescibacteria group bacterium]